MIRVTVAVVWLSLLAFPATPGAVQSAPTAETRKLVGPRDFFLYSCVREYAKAHAVPLFDNSVGYAVEYSQMSPEVMTRLYDAAKAFALSMRAPDLTDEEHGGVAVLASCLEEARSDRVEALIAAPQSTEDAPPRFEDFPVIELPFRPVPPDVRKGRAHRYRTVLREGAREGPNFAGHSTLVRWGCGTCCNEFAIIDARTGEVYFPEFTVSCIVPTESRFGGEVGIDARQDSALLVITGRRNEAGGGKYYYEWTGTSLRLLLAIEVAGTSSD